MKFDEYWKRLQASNAALNVPGNTMRLSVESFKSQLEKAWNAAGGDIPKDFENILERMGRLAKEKA